MEKSNSVKNPIVIEVRLTKDEGVKIRAPMYKQLIGSLMYLTATRPDLMFVVFLMSKFMASPTELHMQAAKRVLRCLKGTIDLRYRFGNPLSEKKKWRVDSIYWK